MALFDPWMLAQPGGGLLGGRGERLDPEDIAKLIAAYPGRWAGLPTPDAPQETYGDPNATPMPAGSTYDPFGRPGPLVPRTSQFDTTKGGITELPVPPPTAATAPYFPPAPPLSAATSPADVQSLIGGYPQTAAAPEPLPTMLDLPMPRPRPQMPPDAAPAPPAAQPPQTAAAPAAAAPAAAAPGNNAYAAAQPAEPSIGPMDRLGAFSANLNSGGNALSALINAFTGAATGQRMDAQSISQENRAQMQRAVFGALMKQGGRSPQEAYGMSVAIASNPQHSGPLLQQLFGNKYSLHMQKDMLGADKPVVFDANTGTLKDAQGGGTGAPSPGTVPENYDDKGRDEAFLKTLDPVTRSSVEAAVRGDMPGSRNLQKIMPLAMRYDKNFSGAMDWETRRATAKNYTSGEGSRGLRSAGTTIVHGIQLNEAIEELKNADFVPGVTNRIRQGVGKQFDPKVQAAIKKFEVNAELYAKELDVALTGKSTVSGAEHVRAFFDPYASTTQNKAALTKTLEMLDGRLQQHAHTYNQGMKTNKSPIEMLAKDDQANLQKLLKAGGSTHAAEPSAHRKDPPPPQASTE